VVLAGGVVLSSSGTIFFFDI